MRDVLGIYARLHDETGWGMGSAGPLTEDYIRRLRTRSGAGGR
ncbi:hypothetical protein Mnod_4045 [Methylobacterium nodulans ORS 2060]|uniref:Uncharacterized protein n=1 Tax=Methylobacterium nodulans (strain LMG 21967 / CNCM I-2342 / ORS 2060) TaxID=460265 RepID=B8ITK8_METNO|nr:hypothetical protein Mnod_4045 [Methylobacterium nodulans ORS 2060]